MIATQDFSCIQSYTLDAIVLLGQKKKEEIRRDTIMTLLTFDYSSKLETDQMLLKKRFL